jgi:hypothetical protein
VTHIVCSTSIRLEESVKLYNVLRFRSNIEGSVYAGTVALKSRDVSVVSMNMKKKLLLNPICHVPKDWVTAAGAPPHTKTVALIQTSTDTSRYLFAVKDITVYF